jgi:DNA-binding PadR family transcriptional regulator
MILWNVARLFGQGLTARRIHELSGVGLRTLYSHLPRWHRIGYVTRRLRDGVYVYRLAARGNRFLFRFASIFLPVDRFRAEIEEHQRVRAEEERQENLRRRMRMASCQEKLRQEKATIQRTPISRNGASKYKLLHVLQRETEPWPALSCRIYSGVSMGATMVALGRMSEAGLVESIRGPRDRPVLHYRITEAGCEYLVWARKHLDCRALIREIDEWQSTALPIVERLSIRQDGHATAADFDKELRAVLKARARKKRYRDKRKQQDGS